jgi:glucosamine 6-phosphate synthetase-like amidotransferase/phosphosugar isomerase protein
MGSLKKKNFDIRRYGVNVPTAYEVALKIKEASYDNTEGFQIEQYFPLFYIF